MKKLVLLTIFILVSILCNSQNYTVTESYKGVVIEKIVDMNGYTKSSLYKNALKWAVREEHKFYSEKPFKTTIKSKEESIGQIIVNIKELCETVWVEATLTIEIKDNKYRYMLENIFTYVDMRDYGEGIIKEQLTSESFKKKSDNWEEEAYKYFDKRFFMDIEMSMYERNDW